MNNENDELLELDEQMKGMQERRNVIVAERKQGVIDKIKEQIFSYNITAEELGITKDKLPAKYRNEETGDEWSGKGIMPKWVKEALATGKSLDDFLIS
jgi:DNA-binding protein H-NS